MLQLLINKHFNSFGNSVINSVKNIKQRTPNTHTHTPMSMLMEMKNNKNSFRLEVLLFLLFCFCFMLFYYVCGVRSLECTKSKYV